MNKQQYCIFSQFLQYLKFFLPFHNPLFIAQKISLLNNVTDFYILVIANLRGIKMWKFFKNFSIRNNRSSYLLYNRDLALSKERRRFLIVNV